MVQVLKSPQYGGNSEGMAITSHHSGDAGEEEGGGGSSTRLVIEP